MTTSGGPQGGPGYPTGPPVGSTPSVRFDAIGEAWNIYKQQMGPWILASLLLFIVIGAIMGLFIGKLVADIISAGPRHGAPTTLGLVPQLLFTLVINVVAT